MNTGWPDRFQRFQAAALLVVGLSLLFLIGLPSLTALYDLSGRNVPPQLARMLPALEPIYAWMLKVFLAVWIVFFGGCIASFLNVVAWRLPRGNNILGRSHCPQCGTQLSLRENLPLYGWLACGGKCRYCDQPIPPRYFLVELAFGLILLLVGWLEVGWAGWSLPRPLAALTPPATYSLLFIHPNLLWLFGSHVCLLSALFAYTLTRLESRRIPLGIFWVALIAALALLVANPAVAASQWLGLDSFRNFSGDQAEPHLLGSLGLALSSLGLGVACGWLTAQILGAGRSPMARRLLSCEASLVLATVGIYLGLCSTLLVSLLALTSLSLQRRFGSQRTAYSLVAMLATILYLCSWRLLF